MGFALDFSSDDDLDKIDRGNSVEPGWYRAVLTDTSEDKNGNQSMEWTVKGGASDGSKVFDTLVNPSNPETEKGQKFCAQRAKLYASRLGLLKGEELGQSSVELDWMQAIGGEYVLNLALDSYSDQQGNKREKVKPKFDGVFPLDHEKIPDAVRKALSLPPARKKGGAPPTAGNTTPAAPPAASQAAPTAGAVPEVDISNL